MRKLHARLNVERLEAREVLSVTYTPAQIRHAYGFDQLPAWVDGSGQTIAIVDAQDNPYIVNDLITFDRAFGIPDPPSFTKVNQSGGTRFPAPDKGWAGEISLDVEWAHAIAPRANILLVEANSASLVDLYTAVDYARNQPGVVTVSMSFGGSEGSYEPYVDNNILITPAGHVGGYGLPGGITFVASSGDHDVGLYPAYSPNVLAVGGTSLYLDSQDNYLGETGWSETGTGWASGGGISQIEPEPAYQYSVHNLGARTVPDVAYNADLNTGFWVFTTLTGGWGGVGGTSAGAPQWAAQVALADQARAVMLGVGSLDGASETLPAIYSPIMSGDFNDVTVGYNGYFAGPGYDLVTGLGSPYSPWVVYDLAMAGFESGASAPAAKNTALSSAPADVALSVSVAQLQGVQSTKSAIDNVFAEPRPSVVTPTNLDVTPTTEDSGRVSAHVSDVPKPDKGLDFLESGIEIGLLNLSL
jgi:subtilase family serine protease